MTARPPWWRRAFVTWCVVLVLLHLLPRQPAQTGWAVRDLRAAESWWRVVRSGGVLWLAGLLAVAAAIWLVAL